MRLDFEFLLSGLAICSPPFQRLQSSNLRLHESLSVFSISIKFILIKVELNISSVILPEVGQDAMVERTGD